MVERKILALGHFVWVRILLGQYRLLSLRKIRNEKETEGITFYSVHWNWRCPVKWNKHFQFLMGMYVNRLTNGLLIRKDFFLNVGSNPIMLTSQGLLIPEWDWYRLLICWRKLCRSAFDSHRAHFYGPV